MCIDWILMRLGWGWNAMCHLVNMHRSGQWNITIGSTKKIIDKLIIAKDIIVEGSSKILILQKDSVFFYHREGFKSGFIFIKKANP